MGHGTNIIKAGQIIRTSRNLRGMLDYARVSPVTRIESCDVGAMGKDGTRCSGTVRVIYADGAESRANFASYHVMIDWLRNRRTWRNAKHAMQGPDVGYLTIPGVIAGTVKTVRDTHIIDALARLNAARNLTYPDVGYSYYADIKGDGVYRPRVYTVTNARGGVTHSSMNGATKRKTLERINAAT